MYFGKDFCAYCTITKDIKNSGDAKATRTFTVSDHSKLELLIGKNKTYLQEKDINQVFDQYFLSSNAMDGLLSEIDTCLTKVEKCNTD